MCFRVESISDISCFLGVWNNTFKQQFIAEFQLTEPLLGERLSFSARLCLCCRAVHSLSGSLSIWKGNTIMDTQRKPQKCLIRKNWNNSHGTWTWVRIKPLPRCLILDKAFDLAGFDCTFGRWCSKDNEIVEHKIGALEQLTVVSVAQDYPLLHLSLYSNL